ncbi:MAG: IS66 family transposase [Opitutaceae bacterium]|jgi:hypothetical protein
MSSSAPSSDLLQSKVTALEAEIALLRKQVEDLRRQLWGRKSERSSAVQAGAAQSELFADPSVAPAVEPVAAPKQARGKTHAPMGPKPLDPSLPRETVKLADPELKDLICPVTKRPMQVGFVETLEVLRRRPAVWYVQRLERNVWVSAAKMAPVYSEWPCDVLPRSRVHVSVVAYIAAQHFCEHQPYYRLEKHLERLGVNLPRASQVSLMKQLDERVKPLVDALQAEVLASGYVHMDATPVDLCDPDRPGQTRESTLWAYRANQGAVWFQFQLSKSATHPNKVLVDAKYQGLLQTDGAPGFDKLGIEGLVTHLGCWAHCRRYFFKAEQAGDKNAASYMALINRLFRIDRLASHFNLSEEHRSRFRLKHSHPLFKELVAKAREDTLKTPPKSGLGEALHYMLARCESLERCITVPRARLDNNPAENAVRPLKLGAKNWLQIGHPDSGSRLANLFTLVENCRQEGIDPEAYLIDIIARLLDHPMKRIGQMLPRQWKLARSSVASRAAVPQN